MFWIQSRKKSPKPAKYIIYSAAIPAGTWPPAAPAGSLYFCSWIQIALWFPSSLDFLFASSIISYIFQTQIHVTCGSYVRSFSMLPLSTVNISIYHRRHFYINDTFYQLINTNTRMYMILDRHSRRRMKSILLLIEGQTNLHWPISIEKNLPSWTPGKRHQPGFNNHNYFQKSRHATRLIFIQSTKLHTLFHMGICNAE